MNPSINRQKIIIIIAVILMIVILASILFSRNKPDQTSPIPVSSDTEQSIGQSRSSRNLKVVGTSLQGALVGWTEPLIVEFSEPTPFQFIDITITPETKYSLSNDLSGYKVIINPTDAWLFNSNYSITIGKKTHTADNNYLNEDFVYNFKTYPYSGI